jgi:hypothetical protein
MICGFGGIFLYQEFVGVGDEVEEGVEVGLVFSFVEAVKEGAFFGAGFIFFLLLDEQFGGEDFAAEVAVIEVGVVDAFVEDLELGDGEAWRQQFEEDGVKGGFIAKLAFGIIDHAEMIEDEVGHFFEQEPFGVVFGSELSRVAVDIDKGEVGHADGAFDGIAVRVTEGFHLFQINVFEAGQFFEDTVGGLVEALLGLQEATHQGPVSFFGLKSTLDEQELNIGSVKSEDDAVDGYEQTGFTGVFCHVLRH